MKSIDEAISWIQDIRNSLTLYEEGLSTEAEVNNRISEAIDPPWIPCSARMPQPNEFVLVALPFSEPKVALAQYVSVYKNKDLSDYSKEDLEDIDLDEALFLVGSHYCLGIKHWMYLPQLPKDY